MSYLDHIRRCNLFDPTGFVPFKINHELIGWSKQTFVDALIANVQDVSSVFEFHADHYTFAPHLSDCDSRTAAIAPVVEALHQQGIIDSWVNETYAITNTFGEAPYFYMERAAVAYFGVRSYGVHLNGLVKKADGIYVWVARRTRLKPFWPGKLDQIVAGGQPAGISLRDNLIKEAAEEASIPQHLAEQAEFVGEIHYRGKNTLKKSPKNSVNDCLGMNSDTLFNYDVWLPEDFTPVNTDGEVDEFMLMPIAEVAHLTDTTVEFKNNCNLVNIDLLLRQGIIDNTHADYDTIQQELYAPAALA